MHLKYFHFTNDLDFKTVRSVEDTVVNYPYLKFLLAFRLAFVR